MTDSRKPGCLWTVSFSHKGHCNHSSRHRAHPGHVALCAPAPRKSPLQAPWPGHDTVWRSRFQKVSQWFVKRTALAACAWKTWLFLKEWEVSVPQKQPLSAGFCWKSALSFQPLRGMWTSENMFVFWPFLGFRNVGSSFLSDSLLNVLVSKFILQSCISFLL